MLLLRSASEHMPRAPTEVMPGYALPLLDTDLATLLLCSHQTWDQSVPEILSAMALRRRTSFADRNAAVASWAAKLPFSNFDSRALQLYAQHGLRDLSGDQKPVVCCGFSLIIRGQGM
jgi:hypothetical protein